MATLNNVLYLIKDCRDALTEHNPYDKNLQDPLYIPPGSEIAGPTVNLPTDQFQTSWRKVKSDIQKYFDHYKVMKIDDFLSLAARASSLEDALKKWIDSFDGAQENNLFTIFDSYPELNSFSTFSGQRGICCIADIDIDDYKIKTIQSSTFIVQQLHSLEARSAAFTAVLLSNWFERLFECNGIEVWLNKYFEASESMILQAKEVIENNGKSFTIPEVEDAIIGIVNYLPVNTDIVIEVELCEDGTHKDVWESGLDLSVFVCERQKRENTGLPDLADPFYTPPGSTFSESSSPAILPSDHYEPALGRNTLDEKSQKATYLLSSVDPFNFRRLGTQRIYSESILAPSQGTGGITREQQRQLKMLQPTPPKESAMGVEELVFSLVRFHGCKIEREEGH